MVSRSRLKSFLTGLALYTMAAAMVGYFGGTTGVSLMMIGLALITLVAALVARETKGEPLNG